MGYWWILVLAKKDWFCSIITYGWYLLFTAPVISPLHFEDFVFDELKIHFSFLVCHKLLDGKVVLLEVGPLLLQVVELRKHKGVFVNKWRYVKILPILIFFITYCLSFKIQTLSSPEEHDWPKCMCLKNQKLSLRKKKVFFNIFVLPEQPSHFLRSVWSAIENLIWPENERNAVFGESC